MHTNINYIKPYDETISGIFYLQSLNYKKHFEVLIKNFYPNKDIIPQGNFNAFDLIETYFPDIISQFNKPKTKPKITPTDLEPVQNKNQPQKQSKKQPLITDVEAEAILLKTIFNLDTKHLK